MNEDCLKLTTYFGERDRAGSMFLADALTEIYARHALQTSLILRGTAGFGAKQHLRSDRQLTLSEDLPVVSAAVDARDKVEQVAAEVERLAFDGLVTLERARMLTEPIEPPDLREQTKLTVYLGRRRDHQAAVALLHRAGIAGATVLLGVDGTAHGVRQRARFFGRNADVPLMIISVGDGERIAAVLPELGRVVERPLVTLERITVCKRDGQLLAAPPQADAGDWQKLMVYVSEQARHGHHPAYLELVRRLRAAGAAGATSLRGIWGYHGDHRPHGDTLWQLRRRVPVVTVVVDRAERIGDWFAIADELTSATGLITCEAVPSVRPQSGAALASRA